MNHRDGTVVDANLGPPAARSEVSRKNGMNSIFLGQVIALYPIDNPQNRSKTQVEYDVSVMEYSANIVTYRHCAKAQDFGGINNFNEVVLSTSPDMKQTLHTAFT